MHGQEVEIGGNPALAQAIVDELNQRAVEYRAAQARQEQNRLAQVANLTGNLALRSHRPYFVQNPGSRP